MDIQNSIKRDRSKIWYRYNIDDINDIDELIKKDNVKNCDQFWMYKLITLHIGLCGLRIDKDKVIEYKDKSRVMCEKCHIHLYFYIKKIVFVIFIQNKVIIYYRFTHGEFFFYLIDFVFTYIFPYKIPIQKQS